jgi:hypothetical protein
MWWLSWLGLVLLLDNLGTLLEDSLSQFVNTPSYILEILVLIVQDILYNRLGMVLEQHYFPVVLVVLGILL